MPIYEFVCQACDHFFETIVPRPGAKAPCPECGSTKVKQAISRPGAFAVGGNGGGEICDPPSCAKGP